MQPQAADPPQPVPPEGAAPPLLEPSMRFPLEANPDGSVNGPELAFDPAGSVLLIRQNVGWPGLSGWFAWHAPDLAAAGILLTLIAVSLAITRVLRRRQSPGQYYCRTCNYDLTGPGGMPPEPINGQPAACPECGTSVGPRGPSLGRPTDSRLVRPLLIALTVLAIAAVVLCITLQTGTSPGWAAPWQPELTRVLGLRPLIRRETFDYEHTRVRVYALPSGNRTSQFLTDMTYGAFALSSDARHLVYAHLGRTPDGLLRVRDLITSEERGVEPVPGGFAQPMALVPSADPRRFYAAMSVSGVTATGYQAKIVGIDLRSGLSTDLGGVEVPYVPLPNGNQQALSAQVAIREVNGAPHWAVAIYEPAAPGPATTGTLHITTSEGQHLDIPWTLTFGFIFLDPASTTLRISDGRGGGADIDLRTGLPTPLTAAGAWTWSEPDAMGRIFAKDATSGDARIIDTAGATVCTLQTPTGAAPGWPAQLSPDGRWAAAFCTTIKTSITGKQTTKGEVLVWDLSHLPR
jgi:hypothetical protein